jgi:hypothetical protein
MRLTFVHAGDLCSPVYWLYILLVPLTANLLDISLK